MTAFKKIHCWLNLHRKPVFYVTFIAILSLSATLRLWGLGDIKEPILDETSIPKLGYAYILDQKGYPFPLAHPPVSNYLFAASIWSYYQVPGIDDAPLGGDFDQLNPVSYRWLNAVMSCFIPFFAALIALRLGRNRAFALLVCLFVGIEHSVLIEARVAMNNSHVLFFGLMGCTALVYAIHSRFKRILCIVAGIAFGLGAGVKWNALGFPLAALGCVLLLGCIHAIDTYRPIHGIKIRSLISQFRLLGRSSSIGRLFIWEWPIYLILVPALTYAVIWLPEYQFNKVMYGTGIMQKHKNMTAFHSEMPMDAHPACSPPISWAMMTRTMGYHLKQLPHYTPRSVSYILSMGNPAIYWMSSVGMIALVLLWLKHAWQWFAVGRFKPHFLLSSVIIMGYCANFLPWLLVPRCLFFYHYQPASIFAMLGLAFLISLGLRNRWLWLKLGMILPIVLIIAATINWLPFAIGYDIPSTRFESLMWLPSWR